MNWFWRILAFIVSRRPIADWLIRRAQRTPYFHLPGYMNRWWLFNGYSSDQSLPPGERAKTKRWPRLPSIRVHHILREDLADHPHDHPWDARTIILRGHYVERRLYRSTGIWTGHEQTLLHARLPGDTARLDFGQFHHVQAVGPEGVWTLFITFEYRGKWGFLVDGQKMDHEEYEKQYPTRLDIQADGRGNPG